MDHYQPPTQILPALFLGGYREGYDKNWLLAHGVGAVVSCAEETEPMFPTLFESIDLDMPDSPRAQDQIVLANKIERAADYINTQIRGGKVVYVHCLAGVNRSATVVIRYLMKYHRLSFFTAINYVKHFRVINLAPIYKIIVITSTFGP